MKYVLASASPRRKEILSTVGLDFSIVVADADEKSDITEPVALTRELAARKGMAVAKKLENEGQLSSDTVIISADTVVACGGEILGKPHDREDAKRMLRSLSGRKHTVVSGVALTYRGNTVTDASVTEVYFDKLEDSFIEAYISSGECDDKAGAYAIQGLASLVISKISGSYLGVVGLPINCLYKLAANNGIPFEISIH